jgi:hypothetical protein
MSKPRQRSLRVRVEHEPNRFSDDCLGRIYEQLHSTKSRKVMPDKSNNRGEVEPENRKGASNE